MPNCSKCKKLLKRLHCCHICGENRCAICSFKRDNGKRVCPGSCHILSKSQDIVHYKGSSYKTKRNTPPAPDFSLMDSISVRMWLIKSTHAIGIQKQHPLDGMSSAISVNTN